MRTEPSVGEYTPNDRRTGKDRQQRHRVAHDRIAAMLAFSPQRQAQEDDAVTAIADQHREKDAEGREEWHADIRFIIRRRDSQTIK